MAEVSADDVSLINNNSGPYLILSTRTILDSPPGGNGNGRFDPGETGGLAVALRNIGNQGLADVTALLRSGHNLFRILDSTAGYGSIAPCSTRTNLADPFRIEVDAAIPNETPVPLTLFISGTDYVDTISFTIVVGEIRPTDPIPDGPRQPPLYWAYDDVDVGYPQHPQFSWVEINTMGTRLTLGDDETQVFELPFTWQFYGSQFNQISICGNGWVAPGSTTISAYTNTTLPTATIPGAVCLNWDDLYPPTGGGVWYYHDAANHRFIVEWDSVAYFSPQTVFDKFEVIIYDQTVPTPTGDNVILVQFLTANNYGLNTVGIQDPGQTIAIQALFNGAYHRGCAPLAPGRAIKYTTFDPTAVAEAPKCGLPGPALRVYPNPFTGSVALTLPGTGAATVAIYDNSGRLVRTITGQGRLTWDGRDELGNTVAPGIYFCRLSSRENEAQAKLILAR
ncbi:MAG: T9SS type A sorting domain-containing protein [candidate division WOR-3 bacterium]